MKSEKPDLLALPQLGEDGSHVAKISTNSLIYSAHGLARLLGEVVEDADAETRLEVIEALQAITALLADRLNEAPPADAPEDEQDERGAVCDPAAGGRQAGAPPDERRDECAQPVPSTAAQERVPEPAAATAAEWKDEFGFWLGAQIGYVDGSVARLLSDGRFRLADEDAARLQQILQGEWRRELWGLLDAADVIDTQGPRASARTQPTSRKVH